MIEVRGLSKTYRVHKKEPGIAGSFKSLFSRSWVEKKALKNVSLDVKEGEIVGLVGENGAGKTTLVKILSGIIHPSEGRVSVAGFEPFRRNYNFRKQISLVMGQKAQLWWDLPAHDCFLLLKEIYGLEDGEFHSRLSYLSERLNVSDELNIQIRRLSLGERMKMELIAALLHSPKVVYLDEPTIGLDLMAQKAIREFILEYKAEYNPAIIITSHYMEDIERLCERIVLLSGGSVIYDGSLKKIVSDYALHKVITARLDGTYEKKTANPEIPKSLGTVLEADGSIIRIQTPRDLVPRTASYLLSNFSVIDMNIEEEGIGNVISSILGDKKNK